MNLATPAARHLNDPPMPTAMTLPRAMALAAALESLLLVILAALQRSWGVYTGVAIVLAGVTLVVAARRGADEDRRRRLVLLVLLSAQVAGFLAGPAGTAPLAPFRLLQVATLAGYGGIALAVVLIELRRLAPGLVLLLSVSVAVGLLALEAVLGLAATPAALPVRPEWAAVQGRRPSRDSGSAADARGSASGADSSPGTRFFAGETPEQLLARAASQRGQGPVWSGRADPHPQLGIVYRPHSELRSYYLDDPRGYFEQSDFREQIWHLEVMPGNAAAAEFPAQDPSLVRVAISKASQDTVWNIHLDQAHLGIESRAPYALEFRARAERPRSIRVGVAQGHPPWANLGLYERIELTQDWKSFRPNFFASRSDSNARIHFDLAGSDAPVELSTVILRGPHEGRPVEPGLPAARHFVRYEFNALGCRGGDYPIPRLPRTPRILVLGDAFTLGVGVRQPDTFAQRLERGSGLDAPSGMTGPAAAREVVNCGVQGYGTREERLFYELVGARYQPDLVLLVMGLDDDRWYWEQALREYRKGPGRLARLSAAWRLLRDLQYRRRSYDYERCVADIRELDRVARDHGARLLVAVLPTNSDERWTQLSHAITKGLEGSAIPALVLDQALPAGPSEEQRQTEWSDLHPSPQVHQAAAQELVRFLQKQVPGKAAVDSGRAR
jgi:lysophospholipase L1-like esterase